MGNDISNSLFILGAGFTKAANPDAPLNSELLDAINKANDGILACYSKEYDTPDIEVLLTQIDLELAKDADETLKADRIEIELQIANYFTRFRFKKRPRKEEENRAGWVERFARDVLQPNDTIVSLNYDCYLEGALDNYGVWTPNGGYPIQHPGADGIPVNPNNIIIYKIHGSENFRYAHFGDQVDHTYIGFLIDESIYPVSGLRLHSDDCGSGATIKPCIIAPSFVKIFHVIIAYIMLPLIEKAKEAKTLIIIGCGMRPEDNYLWLLLTRFLYDGNSIKRGKKLIVLDPNAAILINRIEDYCAPNIRDHTDLVPIQSGIEDGIDELLKEIK